MTFDPQAARERCEAATPEPWETHQEGSKRICWPNPEDPKGCRIVAEAEIIGVPFGEADKNAEFIAHARSDLPAALEALAEAQGLLRRVKETRHDEHLLDRHIALEAVEDYLGESG